jgi:uncharacterized protein
MKKCKKCNQVDLENIAKGATFLASGGGGTYESGRNLSDHFVKSSYYKNPTFEIIDVKDVDKDGYAVVVAYLGAPEALKSASYPDGAVSAVIQVQKSLKKQGKKLKYVVPVEIGALSSVVPCLVASKLDLQVIDGDGAGRAVPELTMLSFSSQGVSCSPTILASNRESFFINLNIGDDPTQAKPISDAAVVEKIARPMLGLDQFQEIAGIAIWVMDAKTMRKAIKSTGSLSMVKGVGECIASKGLDDVIFYIRKKGKKVFKLFHGVFDEKGTTSLTAGGFDHGSVTIVNKTERFVDIYQNESLLAWSNKSTHPVVMAPDSITLFVEDEQKAYSVGDIIGSDGKLADNLKGKFVSVIGIAAESFLRSRKEGLISVFESTLKTLGYYGQYEPIEKLNGKNEKESV